MNKQPIQQHRRARVEEILHACGSVLVACSGGVDSVLLATVAARVLGDKAVAATAVSPSLASSELADARAALPRRIESVDTRFGPIRVKVATLPDGKLRATPEYEECRRAAAEHGASLQQVAREAEHAAAHRLDIAH